MGHFVFSQNRHKTTHSSSRPSSPYTKGVKQSELPSQTGFVLGESVNGNSGGMRGVNIFFDTIGPITFLIPGLNPTFSVSQHLFQAWRSSSASLMK